MTHTPICTPVYACNGQRSQMIARDTHASLAYRLQLSWFVGWDATHAVQPGGLPLLRV